MSRNMYDSKGYGFASSRFDGWFDGFNRNIWGISSTSRIFFVWERKLPPHAHIGTRLPIEPSICQSFHSGNYSKRKHIHVTAPHNHLLPYSVGWTVEADLNGAAIVYLNMELHDFMVTFVSSISVYWFTPDYTFLQERVGYFIFHSKWQRIFTAIANVVTLPLHTCFENGSFSKKKGQPEWKYDPPFQLELNLKLFIVLYCFVEYCSDNNSMNFFF